MLIGLRRLEGVVLFGEEGITSVLLESFGFSGKHKKFLDGLLPTDSSVVLVIKKCHLAASRQD